MKRLYNLPKGRSLRQLAAAVRNYLNDEKGMHCLLLGTQDGQFIVQGRAKHGKLTQWVGMDKVICVRLRQESGSTVCVEIGSGEWLKKGLVRAASMVVLWPLTVTSGVGIVQQSQLPAAIDRFIQRTLAEPDGGEDGVVRR